MCRWLPLFSLFLCVYSGSCSLLKASPTLGPTSGGTKLSVYLTSPPHTGHNATVTFSLVAGGAQTYQVPATQDSADPKLLFAITPTFATSGLFVTRVSIDGGTSYQTLPTLFRAYDPPILFSATPSRASYLGGQTVTFELTGLIWTSATLIKLSSPSGFHSILPVQPGSRVGTIRCVLKHFVKPAPNSAGAIPDTALTVSVALNGQQFLPANQTILTLYERPPLRIAFLYLGPITDFGWTYAQNFGRLNIESGRQGVVVTEYTENVPEGQWAAPGSALYDHAFNILMDACRRNVDLVFAGSYGYMDQTLNASLSCARYKADAAASAAAAAAAAGLPAPPPPPATHYLHATGFKTAPLLSTTFGRIYQMRYLAGLVAGRAMARGLPPRNSTCVGYLAAFPIPEVKRGINAFTLGCRAAFPGCDVRVMWTQTWHDPYLESLAAHKFWEEERCDIIAQHSDTQEPQRVYAAKGGLGLGYNSDMRVLVGDSVLTGPMLAWGPLVMHFVDQVLNDAWVPHEQYWGGVETGGVALAPFSPLVDLETRALVDTQRQQLIAGSRRVFCHSNAGAGAGAAPGQPSVLRQQDGSPVPATQPPSAGALYGGTGLPLFDGEGCMTTFPGLLGMDFLVQGTSHPPVGQSDLGSVELTDKGSGLTYYYSPPPRQPPAPPSLSVVNVTANSLSLQLFAPPSAAASAAVAKLQLQWDTTQQFDSTTRHCPSDPATTTQTATTTPQTQQSPPSVLCQEMAVAPSDLVACSPAAGAAAVGTRRCIVLTLPRLPHSTPLFLRARASDGGGRWSAPGPTLFTSTLIVRVLSPPDASVAALSLALGCLALLLSLMSAVALIALRRTKVVRKASPLFCVAAAAGCALCAAFSLLQGLPPSPATCALRPVALLPGVTLVFGSLFIKTHRIHRLFNNRRMRRMVITSAQLLRSLALLLAADALLLLLWLLLDPVTAVTRADAVDPKLAHRVCGSGSDSDGSVSVFLLLSLLYKGGLLLYGCWLVFAVRDVPSEYNESKMMGYAIYNASFTSLLIVALVFILQNPTVTLFLTSLAVAWSSLFNIAVLFFPKFWRVMRGDSGGGSGATGTSSGPRSSAWGAAGTASRANGAGPGVKELIAEMAAEMVENPPTLHQLNSYQAAFEATIRARRGALTTAAAGGGRGGSSRVRESSALLPGSAQVSVVEIK